MHCCVCAPVTNCYHHSSRQFCCECRLRDALPGLLRYSKSPRHYFRQFSPCQATSAASMAAILGQISCAAVAAVSLADLDHAICGTVRVADGSNLLASPACMSG